MENKEIGVMCDDNRFELIEKYKQKLIKATNIETAKEEMKVLDSVLFRMWQMGWLDTLEEKDQNNEIKTKFKIGDKVWTIKKVNKYIKCPKCKDKGKELIGNIEYHCANCYGQGTVLTNELEWVVQKENPCEITRIKILLEKDRTEIVYLGGENIFIADYLG